MRIRFVLTAALLLAGWSVPAAWAQSAAVAAVSPAAAVASSEARAASRYEYGTLVCTGTVRGRADVMYADGKGLQELGDDDPSANQVKKGLRRFASNMDALQYMADQGWEVLQQMGLIADGVTVNSMEMHYLLRRVRMGN